MRYKEITFSFFKVDIIYESQAYISLQTLITNGWNLPDNLKENILRIYAIASLVGDTTIDNNKIFIKKNDDKYHCSVKLNDSNAIMKLENHPDKTKLVYKIFNSGYLLLANSDEMFQAMAQLISDYKNDRISLADSINSFEHMKILCHNYKLSHIQNNLYNIIKDYISKPNFFKKLRTNEERLNIALMSKYEREKLWQESKNEIKGIEAELVKMLQYISRKLDDIRKKTDIIKYVEGISVFKQLKLLRYIDKKLNIRSKTDNRKKPQSPTSANKNITELELICKSTVYNMFYQFILSANINELKLVSQQSFKQEKSAFKITLKAFLFKREKDKFKGELKVFLKNFRSSKNNKPCKAFLYDIIKEKCIFRT